MPSVAVVVLDTVRYDTFEEVFDWLPGRRYTRAYAPSHWTVPVHGSLFTGRYASEIGVHGPSPTLDCPDPVLAEQLQDAGYRTRLFTANPQLKQYDGWERGFDEFVTYGNLGNYRGDLFDWEACYEELSGSGLGTYLRAVGRCVRSDCDTLPSLRQGFDLFRRSDADGGAPETLGRIRATDFGDDEFLFVNLMEAHTPYFPPDDGDDPVVVVAADAFSDEPLDLDYVRRAYRTSVERLSEVYRDIFAELSDDFDYVLTLADHGELLGEHGMVNHSFGLWPELTHVPLVINGPDIADGREDRVTSLLDVHATVAALAGVDVDSRGRNLLADPEPETYLTEYHGLLPFHEAQFERKDAPISEFERREEPVAGFVTPDGAYAYETHTEGFQTEGTFDGDPRARLDDLVAELDRREVEAVKTTVDDEVRSQLEDLGYA